MGIQEYMNNSPLLMEILGELPKELHSTISIRTYKAGETVVASCEDSKDSYIVLEGVCCSTNNYVSGERSWFRKKTVGDVFGLLGMLEYENTFSASIFAKSRCVIARIPCDTMNRCFGIYPVFTREMTRRVVDRLNYELWKVRECSLYPPDVGLITYLIYAYDFYIRSYPQGYTGPVRILEKQTEIASYLCVNVRTLQRILPQVRDENLASIRGTRISVSRDQYEKLVKKKSEYFR